jgi:GT2 family glycosyltransferase/glycosyltransferase involved in cell wall biosynthesis
MGPDLESLSGAALDPLFWPLARTGVQSAWITHVPFAHWLVAAQRPGSIVELGTHNGVSYAAFCEAVQRAGLDCRCLAVDTWEGDEHAGHYDGSVFESLQAFHAARYAGFSELLRCTFDAALPYVPDGSVDLLHIDGLHTYEAVRHDFESWRPKLSRRAVVVMHDTNVRERGFGVWRLFAELRERYPAFEFLHGHGLGVLAVGEACSPAMAALTRLSDREAGRLRERFSFLGSRWQGAMVQEMLSAELSQARTQAAAALSDAHHRAEAARAEKAAADAAGEAAVLAARGALDRALAKHATDHARLQSVIDAGAALPDAYRQAGEHIGNLERLLNHARRDRDWLQSELHQAYGALNDARGELHVVRSSTLWRLAGPVRKLARLLRQPPLPPAASSEPLLPPPGPAADTAAHPPTIPEPAVPPVPTVPDHRNEAVDIVICVHDALACVRTCLDSVIGATLPPYRLIVVDDGSGPETAAYLDRQVREQGIVLQRIGVAEGYTRAVNAGLALTTAPWVVLLNSDTVATPGWLDRMWAHAMQDLTLGVIGPLSNTASWQSVPLVFDAPGDWAENPLPPGMDAEAMGELVADCSLGAVPVGFVNGFCLMLRRAVLDAVGGFDAETFGAGYGEENDYAIRVRAGGWRLAVATDAYVFHAQSMSYAGRRAALAARADQLLLQKHDPAEHIYPQAAACRDNLALAAMRARVAAALAVRGVLARGRARFEGRRLAFILPIAARGGGGAVVLQEGQAMLQMGVDVTMLTLDGPHALLGDIPELAGLVVRSFPSSEAMTAYLVANAGDYDAVVASLYSTVFWLPPAPGFRTGYYVQDYEPLFFPEHSPERAAALLSYTVSERLRLVTKTRWNQAELRRHTGRTATLLGPSVATNAFAPDPARVPGDALRIVAMVRPVTPRRAPQRTMAVLDEIVARLDGRVAAGAVAVHVFGADPAELEAQGLARDWAISEGKLDQPGLAALLGRSDIFVDCSDYQAMGLTALEAMLSGCVVVGPQAGGTGEFVRSGENGLLVDSMDVEACAAAVLRLVADPALLLALRLRAIDDANRLGPEHAALRLLEALLDD